MSDDTAAALIIALDAKFDTLAKNMRAATGVFDAEGRKIAKKQADLKKKLSDWTLDFSGLKGLSLAFAGLTAAGITTGITALVTKSLDAASAIGDTAKAANIGIERLQELRFAASQSGAKFDDMDAALIRLNKSIGDVQNGRGGPLADLFKQLGIDPAKIKDTGQAFDLIVQKLHGYGSEAQKASALSQLFGREAGPKLLQLVDEGGAGIDALAAKAHDLNIVLSAETVAGAKEASDKLDALFKVIQLQGVSAIAALAPEISKFAQEITDKLPTVIRWIENLADAIGLISLDKIQKLQNALSDAQEKLAKYQQLPKSSFGFISNEAVVEIWQNKVNDLQRQLDAAKAAAGEKGRGARSPSISSAAASPTSGAAPIIRTSAADLAAQQRQQQASAAAVLDAKTAGAALAAAQNQAYVDALKGSADYYAAQQQQIHDDLAAKVAALEAEGDKEKAALDKSGKNWKGYEDARANIEKATNDKIAAARVEASQKLYEAGPQSLIDEAVRQGDDQIRQYQQQSAAIGLTAGALAKLTFVQNALNDARARGITLTPQEISELNAEGDAIAAAADKAFNKDQGKNNAIQTLDELRSGFAEIGVAATHGFGSAKDAAASFLGQLADMIVQLYVIKPLLNSLLGQSGTSGGGAIGKLLKGGIGFLGSLFDDGGYTGAGGKKQPAGIVHKGEVVWSQDDVRRAGGVSVVEALRRGLRGYANGGIVGAPQIRMPDIAPISRPQTIINVQQFDVRGAVMTDQLLRDMNAQSLRAAHTVSQAHIDEFNSKVLPSRVYKLTGSPRVR